MGCLSSKQIKIDRKRDAFYGTNGGGDHINHVVSLTSSTYGALKLDHDQPPPRRPPEKVSPSCRSIKEELGPPEIINAWELMEDLQELVPVLIPPDKSARFLGGFAEIDAKTPLKFLNQMGSPKMLQKFSGKENSSPKTRVLKASSLPPNLRISKKGSPNCVKSRGFPVDSGLISLRRRNLGPLFDPNHVGSFKKEQITQTVSGTPATQKSRNFIDSNSILELYEKKSPLGGSAANAVVIYTTTLRGIRKTFEDCNTVRRIIKSHGIRMFERDVSMDSGFKEELRKLMGKKEVKVPVVLVKRRLIGGCDEIVKLEEEGKLGILLDGIPPAAAHGCKGCAGEHFIVCSVCNGGCMLMGRDGKKTLKCRGCNENGLVQCPICCEIL